MYKKILSISCIALATMGVALAGTQVEERQKKTSATVAQTAPSVAATGAAAASVQPQVPLPSRCFLDAVEACTKKRPEIEKEIKRLEFLLTPFSPSSEKISTGLMEASKRIWYLLDKHAKEKEFKIFFYGCNGDDNKRPFDVNASNLTVLDFAEYYNHMRFRSYRSGLLDRDVEGLMDGALEDFFKQWKDSGGKIVSKENYGECYDQKHHGENSIYILHRDEYNEMKISKEKHTHLFIKSKIDRLKKSFKYPKISS